MFYPKHAAYSNNSEDSIAKIAVIARRVLQLPMEVISTQPPPQPTDDKRLAIGLSVTIGIVMVLAVMGMVIFLQYRFVHWVKYEKNSK